MTDPAAPHSTDPPDARPRTPEAGTAVIGFITLLFLEEPKGQMAEINEDGSVELIHVG